VTVATVAIWKGVTGDQRIWVSHFDGDWHGINHFPADAVRTSASPALTDVEGFDARSELFMAWKGEEGDQRLFGAFVNPREIENLRLQGASGRFSIEGASAFPMQIPNANSSEGPALCAFKGGVFMAWKGIGGPERVFFSILVPKGFFINEGYRWTARRQIPGAHSSACPALAVRGGRLFIAWKGVTGDERIFLSRFDADHGTLERGTFTGPSILPENAGRTSLGPGLAPLAFQGNDFLFMAWKASGNPDINITSAKNGGWAAANHPAGFLAARGPALARYDPPDSRPAQNLLMAWRQFSPFLDRPDQRLFFSIFDGFSWTARRQIPHANSSEGPGLLFPSTGSL
jgi:hypothetical protein